MDTNRLRFEGMSDDERVYRRYRNTDMDEKSFLNDVKYDIDARLRTSMSTRGAKLYDGLLKTGAVLWGGYSFLEEGKSLTFSLETSDSSKAKFSFNREEEGSIVFTHRISPKYQQLLKFEVTSENDADGVFLRYTRTLN